MENTEIKTKHLQYGIAIVHQIHSMFQEDSENFIDLEEFKDSDNLTEFIHAIATVAPAFLYNELSGDNKTHIEFNHLADSLCFDFTEK